MKDTVDTEIMFQDLGVSVSQIYKEIGYVGYNVNIKFRDRFFN